MEHVIFTYHGPKLKKDKVMMSGFLTKKHSWTLFMPCINILSRTSLTSNTPLLPTEMNIIFYSLLLVQKLLIISNKGYPHISGHSFRIGGTTFYLISGVPPNIVKKFGCWHSQVFLEYWHCLDYLRAIHIKMLPLKAMTCKNARSNPKA